MLILEDFKAVKVSNQGRIVGGETDTPGGYVCYGTVEGNWTGDCAHDDGTYSYYGLTWTYFCRMLNRTFFNYQIQAIVILLVLFFMYSSCSFFSHDIIIYHSKINKAEKAIVCEDFNSAYNMYRSSFKHIKSPFAIDLYNYMMVCIELDRRDEVISALLDLIKRKGVTYKYIQRHSRLIYLRNYLGKDLSFLKDTIEEGEEYFRENTNQNLISNLKEIRIKDQAVRRGIPEGQTRYLHPDLLKSDSINFIDVQQIFNKYGYPSEDLVGVVCDDQDEYSLFLDDYLNVVIRHQFGNLNYDPTLITFLKKAVVNGLLSPDILASNLSNYLIKTEGYAFSSIRGLIGDASVTKINNHTYKSNMTSQEIEQLNKKRNEFFLESYQDDLCKAIFRLNSQKFQFSYAPNIAKFQLVDQNQVEGMISHFNLVPVEAKDCDCK